MKEKLLEKSNAKTVPDLDLGETAFSMSEFFPLNTKQNSSYCKQKGVQDHIKNSLEAFECCLENIEIKYGLNYTLRTNKHETSIAKQEKIALRRLMIKDLILISFVVCHGAENLALERLPEEFIIL